MKVVYHHRNFGPLAVVLDRRDVATHVMVVRDFVAGVAGAHLAFDNHDFDLADVDRIEVIR